MGKIRKSIESYHLALKSFPEYVEAQYHLGLAYLKEGSRTLAAGAFEKVIESVPDSHFAQESKKHLESMRN